MAQTDIKSALDDLLNRQNRPIEEAIDRHFSREYRQRTNGRWDDREGFTLHAIKLREVIDHARIEVLDEFRAGNKYADRHEVHVTKRDGSKVVQEVYLFAEMDSDGRFARVEETTLLITGSDADREMGSMK